MTIDVKIKRETLLTSPNVADQIDSETLAEIGTRVWDGWDIDAQSRGPWEDKMKESLDFALQVAEDKTFPWIGASNVKFPLVTIAALQYHARAYPSLLPGSDIVKCKVFAKDPDGELQRTADRIEAHMSYQLLEEDEAWEDNMDRVLITQPIIGCAFKKSYYDPVQGHNVSKNILAKDLYIPYYAESLETSPRITEIIYLTHNDVYERVARGLYVDYEDEPAPAQEGQGVLEAARSEAQGIVQPGDDPIQPIEFLEQHCFLDLDGDGYEEPYVVTVRKDTKQVYRIVARYFDDSITYGSDGKTIISIRAEQYYTKFPFIPSPDGGIYDLGFGVLLGPLNASIDTILNQLIDAGTLSNTAGGFLGRGVKLKGGDHSFRPFEWKRVDSTGDDLAKGIYPLPVREPSAVLFQLLGLLIDYGERIGMATDPMTGQNVGQNTKTGTMDAMIREGERVFNGIFKRTYRALKSEFRKLYRLNQIYLPDENDFDAMFAGVGAIQRKDYMYSSKIIFPAADPYMVSDTQKLQQAMALKQASMSTQGYNKYEVEKRYLTALQVQDIDQVFPDPKGPNAIPPQPHPKVQIEQMKAQVKQMDMQMKAKMAQMELMQEAEVNRAKILKLEADAVKALAEADGVKAGHTVALIQAQIGAAKHHQDGILKVIEILQKQLGEGSDTGRMAGMANPSGNQGVPQLPAAGPEGASTPMG